MPKTIIKIKTWSCQCGYHQDFEPIKELMLKYHQTSSLKCPSCKKGKLVVEIDPNKKVTLTVTGEEDIEDEIKALDEEKVKDGKAKMSDSKKDSFRIKRQKEIADAVVTAKLLEDK